MNSNIFSLSDFMFNNRFTRDSPADPLIDNTRRQVLAACYSYVDPTPVSNPKLVSYSPEVATQLGLSALDCGSDLFTQVFAGNILLKNSKPYAQCYGGHQFGHWAGQLGDGRAINLGEVITPAGDTLALQLKGAGATPYSRTADGLAVLRSSVREYLCSEAMFHLGVPTTRALSLVTTGEQVVRDMFYDGRPQAELGAIVCRVSPSFLRFGSFEIFTSRGDIDTLKHLVDFTIRTHFPHLGEPNTDVYLSWFKAVCDLTANMVTHWMRVGFVHGVMNTDNMSILGLTIDYGPYGWLEDYDPNWTPNTTDATDRRYRFGNQSAIAQWNLFQLANALYPLINDATALRDCISNYATCYDKKMQPMYADKLGLEQYNAVLQNELHNILQLVETDMTIFYRQLSNLTTASLTQSDDALFSIIRHAYYDLAALSSQDRQRICDWLRDYQYQCSQQRDTDVERKQKMDAVNPKYVLRNYLAQLAIDKAELGDNSLVDELLAVLRHPYDEQIDKAHYAEKRPDWARERAGCSMLSCSS